jgi:hypothetical protein
VKAPKAVFPWPVVIGFEFRKSNQLFIRTHNEPLPVAAIRVSNPDLEKPRLLPTESFLSDPSDDLIADDF